jgi:hypothetical protein
MTPRAAKVVMSLALASFGISAVAPGATASTSDRTLRVTQILAGSSLHHTYTPEGSSTSKVEELSNPDDISVDGQDLFVGFQNGVGPQGEARSDGNLDSSVVEISLSGRVLGQWDVVGKADGVTADPALGGVIATVNEDNNSALYLIKTSGVSASDAVTRYAYSEALPHGGGTDAISIYDGEILISASAPGTTGDPAPQPTYPAVYEVNLDPATKIARVTPLFDDEAEATVANTNGSNHGRSTKLALTDPDSNEVVPSYAVRFRGDFMLTSQGDEQQIFVSSVGTSRQRLSVLNITQSADDTAWPSSNAGRLYSTDSTDDAVDVITGSFQVGMPLAVVTPCGANGAPATCPAAGFPNNYLASINPDTGVVTVVSVKGATYVPQGGLAFVGGHG